MFDPRWCGVLTWFLLLVAWGCSRPPSAEDTRRGRLRILLQGEPAERVDQVWVEVDGISVHHERRGWMEASRERRPVELSGRGDGAAATMAVVTLPAGTYTRIRMRVGDAHVIVGGVRMPLRVPTGGDGSIELARPFAMPGCGTMTLRLRWDVGAHLGHDLAHAYVLQPALVVERPHVDDAMCCGGALCVGGTCRGGTCGPGDPEGTLVLEDATPERVSGLFGRNGRSLGFHAYATAGGRRITVTSATGHVLLDVRIEGHRMVTSLLGGRSTSTTDLALLAESARLATAPPEHRASFSLEDAVVVEGDPTAAGVLAAHPEYALLPWLSRALGAAGLSARDAPATLLLHKVGVQAALDLEMELPPLPEPQAKSGNVAGCTDLRDDPHDNGALGMCGRSDDCWEWVCGDCCCRQGCLAHDHACRKCSWYAPWNCFLCASFLAFLDGTCDACRPQSGYHEPPCKRPGEPCREWLSCCGAVIDADEGSAGRRAAICEPALGECLPLGAPRSL